MAEALIRLVLQNLTPLIQNEFGLIWGVEEELQKLSSMFSTIQDVLQDAEDRQVKDKIVRNWLEKLRDLAYDADDVLDDCAIEALGSRHEGRVFSYQVCKSFLPPFCIKRILLRHRIASRIKGIRERLDAIAEERSKIHLRGAVVERGVETGERMPTDSFVIESEIYGREEDKEKIVELLLNCLNCQENVSVIPILGMGGLGKTTLAQLAYKDSRVEGHFELRMWVYVSADFELRRLIKAIVESAGGNSHDGVEVDSLQSLLHMTLRGKRLLLVLDDVWNEDEDKWDRLRSTVLTYGARGSAVIVTTRIEKVACIMGTIPVHYNLGGLSTDDCWSLFRQRAFGDGRREENPKLIAIGKEIVKKCGGVPLAAKTLGSLMRFKNEESEWLFVKESELWELPVEENLILPALRLSYTHLPSQLRQCFAYCSIFPKGFEMDKEELVHLWMANGFVQPKGRMELEDVGHEIFNELLWRSFFQDVQKDEYGNITRCKMHDLMHDLAQLVNGNETCQIRDEATKAVHKKTRHIFLEMPYQSLEFPKTLRTFLFTPHNISTLKYLRALRLSRSSINKLPSSIGDLKHLRYLNLSKCEYEMLPESLGNLQNLLVFKLSYCYKLIELPESISDLPNLQTLDLSECHNLCKLPQRMRNMSNLRHLNNYRCFSLAKMPAGIGQLGSLQTLSRFVVGENRGCSLSELKCLNLKGELAITDLWNVPAMDAREADLISKERLQSLTLEGIGMMQENIEEVVEGLQPEEVVEGLQPHRNLKKLVLASYGGIRFPHWLQAQFLPNLVILNLEYCFGFDILPALGQLPLLKDLTIAGMHAVRNIGTEFYGHGTSIAFPALETMSLKEMPNLEEWCGVDGREVFPRLGKLRIGGCEKLKNLPRFPSLGSLTLAGHFELTSLPEGLLQNLSILQSFNIVNSRKLKTLGTELDNLVALKALRILGCAELVSLPKGLRNLNALEILEIRKCDNLVSLPEEGLQGLTSLKLLHIFGCGKLTSLSEGIQFLVSLGMLFIWDCPQLTSLPEGMQHLGSLQTLYIRVSTRVHLPEWIGNLKSLQHLYINCPNTFLPEWIGNLKLLRFLYFNCPSNQTFLPEWFGNLKSLQTLWIGGCEELVRRCDKYKGEDWHKIAHVPNLHIEVKLL